MSAPKCPSCGSTGREKDRDREPRWAWVCAGCHLTWDEARAAAKEEEPPQVHRISWFVYVGGDRIPHTASMRGQWGYDVTCSCGWDSRLGGGTRRAVKEAIWLHRFGTSLGAA